MNRVFSQGMEPKVPQKLEPISKAHLAAARAVDQLRRQLGIVIQADSGELLGACPIEGLTEEQLSELREESQVSLLLTAARAKTLGLLTEIIRIDAQQLPLTTLQALADPLAEQVKLPKHTPLPATPAHEMLLTLAKYAGLLPAMLVVESKNPPKDWVEVALKDVKEYWSSTPLDIVPLVETSLPIEGAEQARIICFRERYGTSTHLALVFGEIKGTPLARIHSSCLTGDILGSLRCDCGDQLKLALQALSEAESGVLIYLHQEGRGIGIANKLRAYALQEKGIDTYDANLMLGFEEDERDFSIAARILEKLGIKAVRLLTNNPQKIERLKQQGVKVSERVPLIAESGKHSHAYLDAKAKKSGHLF